MSLTPLNCTLKNRKDGKFYVNAYFTTIKEKFKKRYKSNFKKKRGQALESDRSTLTRSPTTRRPVALGKFPVLCISRSAVPSTEIQASRAERGLVQGTGCLQSTRESWRRERVCPSVPVRRPILGPRPAVSPCCRSEEFPESCQDRHRCPPCRSGEGDGQAEDRGSHVFPHCLRRKNGFWGPSAFWISHESTSRAKPCSPEEFWGRGNCGMWLLDFQSLRSRGKHGK